MPRWIDIIKGEPSHLLGSHCLIKIILNGGACNAVMVLHGSYDLIFVLLLIIKNSNKKISYYCYESNRAIITK